MPRVKGFTLHCKHFIIMDRKGMELLGGEELLHYYWKNAMEEK
jgi:hypothetical protein